MFVVNCLVDCSVCCLRLLFVWCGCVGGGGLMVVLWVVCRFDLLGYCLRDVCWLCFCFGCRCELLVVVGVVTAVC